MERRLRARRGPSAYYPTLSTLLFLSALYPPRAFAQDASSTLQTITLTSASSAASSATSAFSSATSAATSLSPSPPTLETTLETSTPTSLANPSDNDSRGDPFNYYFLLMSAAIFFFVAALLYTLRRRRKRAAAIRATQALALSTDVRGFRSPRYGRGWGWPVDGDRNTPPRGVALRGGRGGRRRGEEVEGLDERGEAPPPYTGVGSKPPSLRSFDGISGRCDSRAESARTVERRPSQDVELGDMARPQYDSYEPPRTRWRAQAQGEPPAYPDASPSISGGQAPSAQMETVARPEPAVTRP